MKTVPLVPALLLFLAGCSQGVQAPALFEQLPPSRTNLSFVNELPEATDFNIINYLNYYNGGGIGAGDVNNDGLIDLYFVSNLGPNRLYLNRGDLRFEDVTDRAGVAGAGNWSTGVTMVDINADGYLDLYVTAVGRYLDRNGRNQLFINNGDATFTEQAAAWGLDFSGYGQHAAFFDYDNDGDLDVYLLNHSAHRENTHGNALLRNIRNERAGDRLLRNDSGRFTDVSEVNSDGFADLYVANDFHENDFLYLNNGDGTFTESIQAAMGHLSHSSMGSDVGDFNNDGRPDLAVLDMLPERRDILNTSANAEDNDLYDFKREMGYHHQLVRNVLQLNEGNNRFSDIAPLAGVQATDWSWSALFADLDNDGLKDLFISNGIYRRPNDMDFVAYISGDSVQAALAKGISKKTLDEAQKRMPHVPLANYAFRNNGDLTFTNLADAWGLARPGFSGGTVYADLDNDGDLDLVISNLNEPASVYVNQADTLLSNHTLTVALQGSGGNTGGIGAQVILRYDGTLQMREQIPSRGWMSSVDPRLHFGLGAISVVDSLTVVWPGGSYQTLTEVPAGGMVTLRQEEAAGSWSYPGAAPRQPLFQDLTEAFALGYRHRENTFQDYSREPLIPHKLSMEGPALAVGDVNGDGLDDLYAGGAKWQAGSLLMQQPDGTFVPSNAGLWQRDSLYEDVAAAFLDADADGDLDLYVASGGNEFWDEAEALRDRLYRNDGRGGFSRAPEALPDFFANGSVVAPADFDGDGDTDLFVGSRVVTRHYGLPPRSYLLENDGAGHFSDVTDERAPGLAEAGMVSDAAWTDYDGDGKADLVVVGEWMAIMIFAQQDGQFIDRTAETGLAGTTGWWNAVHAADLDGDNDPDLIAGNLGLNSLLKTSPEYPVRLYLKDSDGDGATDPVLTAYEGGVNYPVASRDMLIRQLPSLADRYPTYTSFGAGKTEDVFPDLKEGATVLEAQTFASSWAENNGDGTFTVRLLPAEAQFAPVYAISTDDFDRDGRVEALTAGNFSGVPPLFGRYDASYGALLAYRPGVGFEAIDPLQSGLYLEGEVRSLEALRWTDGSRVLVAARNSRGLQILRVRSQSEVARTAF